MRILFLILVLIPNIFFAQEIKIPIEIRLDKMPDGILFYLNEDDTDIDSSFSQDEKLKFIYTKKDVAAKSLVIVSADRKYGQLFWIEDTAIKLRGTYKDFSPLLTEDSKIQNEYASFTNLTSGLEDSLNLLKFELPRILYDRNPDSVIYKEKISGMTNLLKQRKIDFFETHPNSLISTISLFFEASHKRFTNEELLSSFGQLSKEQQNSTYGQGILRSIELYKNPAIGSKAPVFTLNDQNGYPVSLADFNGKNIVLIFWASWCYPCLREMPEIIKAYEEYQNKNVVFIAVSLDEKKDLWVKAIQKNSIPFINISDLKGWMNVAALIYGISSVPDNLLIDANGKIVARSWQFRFMKEMILNLIK